MTTEHLKRLRASIRYERTKDACGSTEKISLAVALAQGEQATDAAIKYRQLAEDAAELVRNFVISPDLYNCHALFGWLRQFGPDLLPHLPPVELDTDPHP